MRYAPNPIVMCMVEVAVQHHLHNHRLGALYLGLQKNKSSLNVWSLEIKFLNSWISCGSVTFGNYKYNYNK